MGESEGRVERLLEMLNIPWQATEGGDIRGADGTDLGIMWDPANAALTAIAVEIAANALSKAPQALETLAQAGAATPTARDPQAISERIEHISGYTIYPSGLTDLDDINAPSFAVEAAWRGEHRGKSGGGWSVRHGPFDLLASSDPEAPQWDLPERFRRWQYRFATFEDALAAARAVVDHVKVNGRTWAQWEEKKGEGAR